jgi:hypothetical protein
MQKHERNTKHKLIVLIKDLYKELMCFIQNEEFQFKTREKNKEKN